MRNLILLLVLGSGFLSGYLIGDYRGKNAREALQKAIETGKTLDAERETAISRLKTELDGINETHRQELEAIRKENNSRIALWRRSKSGLNEQIRRSTANLDSANTRLATLTTQRNGASGADAARLDMEIERLRKEREGLRREIDGNTCLQTPIPNSVFEALNETIHKGTHAMKIIQPKLFLLLLVSLYIAGCKTLPLVPHAVNCDVNAELLASKCAPPKPISNDISYATLVDTMQADRKALRDCNITTNALRDAIRRCNRATAEYNQKIDAINSAN